MFLENWHESWNDFMNEKTIEILNSIEERIKDVDYYPRKEKVLRFLETDLNNIKYIIVGMEPYPSFDNVNKCPQATGRSFEVSEILGQDWNYKIKQSSLRNILKALYYNETKQKESMANIRKAINDKKFTILNPGDWFNNMEVQGVLFLNSTLTVEASNVGSHKKIWDEFRELLINFLKDRDIKWMLWGSNAKEEVGKYLDNSKILTAPHPRLDNFILENTFQYATDINWKGI